MAYGEDPRVEKSIRLSVALKTATDIYCAYPDSFDTEDHGPEVVALTEWFYEYLENKIDELVPPTKGNSRNGSRKNSSSTSKRSSGSRKSSEKSSGSNRGPRDPNKPASERQVAAIEKLLNANDVDFDEDGFELDGVDYAWDELTMGNVQPVFDYFKD